MMHANTVTDSDENTEMASLHIPGTIPCVEQGEDAIASYLEKQSAADVQAGAERMAASDFDVSRVVPSYIADSDKEDQKIVASHLDLLPVELKIEVLLHLPDQESLKALVQSSPLYYNVYRSQRHNILMSISKLPNMSVETFAQALSVMNNLWSGGTSDIFIGYLDRLDDVVMPAVPLTIQYPVFGSIEHQFLNFQHIGIEKAIEMFCKSTLSCHPIAGEKLGAFRSLSRTETKRIRRAMYRFERWAFSFRDHHWSWLLEHVQLALRFESWEMEEIACIYEWVSTFHFQNMELCSSLRGSSKKFGPRCLDRLLDDFSFRKAQNIWTASTKVKKVKMSKQKSPRPPDKQDFSDERSRTPENFRKNPERARIAVYLVPETRRQLLGTKQEFHGEDDGPNAGWVWGNYGRYTLEFSEESKEGLRKWGYVMWDRSRLEELGALEKDPMNLVDQFVAAVDLPLPQDTEEAQELRDTLRTLKSALPQ